jgi:hypothetical protein
MLLDNSAVAVIKRDRSGSHAYGVPKHKNGNSEDPHVAENSPNCHPLGFPFRHQCLSQPDCSTVVTMAIWGSMRF